MVATTLRGWGRALVSAADVVPGPVHDGASSAVDGGALAQWTLARGALARGMGRSYGDAAQNAGGLVLDMPPVGRMRALDTSTGRVRLDAGVTLDELLRAVVGHGWWLPVTPGTRMVSVGGAIAADVHGKNHPAAGSFGSHVRGFTLLTADGRTQWITPDDDRDVFAATLGGMGLTGVVLDAELALRRIATTAMRTVTVTTGDLDGTLARLEDSDATYRVATVDLMARGPRLGRAIVETGEHAEPDELPRDADRLAYAPDARTTVPDVVPTGVLNRYTARALTTALFARAPRRPHHRVVPVQAFFHPLDAIGGWNRLYGSRGFVQYQFAVPSDQTETVRRIASVFAGARCPTFVVVLKRLGPGAGMLSFPIDGWTLAVDIPAGVPGLARLLERCDDLVCQAGGRVYLAKDGRLRAERMATMYPELERWRAVRDRLDPQARWRSDLGRRLGLCPR